MSGVFISYRRDDSGGYAGRLFDILNVRFGSERTFMDLDDIKGGDDFTAVIDQKVGQCSVLLALIGERWLTLTGEGGRRRLDMPGDFVRLEIAKALERGVRVVPVLVGGATMPRAEDLPEPLRPLAVHQAIDLRDAHFHADAAQLVDLLRTTVPGLGVQTWFTSAGRWLRAAATILLLGALAAGAVLYRQSRAAAAAAAAAESARAAAARVAGKWSGRVKYDWGAAYIEKFDFEVAGQALSGTASFLETARALFDGRLDGNRISFTTKSLTSLANKTYEDKHYYKGTVQGDTIQFTMLTDSGADSHVPIEFTVRR